MQEHVIAIFGKNMLLTKMAITGNNNNNSQIIAKVGNKLLLCPYVGTWVTFLPFLATICFQKLPKMAIFIDLKVTKNGNNWLQIIAKIGNKMVTLRLYRNLSHIFASFGNILLPKVAKK